VRGRNLKDTYSKLYYWGRVPGCKCTLTILGISCFMMSHAIAATCGPTLLIPSWPLKHRSVVGVTFCRRRQSVTRCLDTSTPLLVAHWLRTLNIRQMPNYNSGTSFDITIRFTLEKKEPMQVNRSSL
jgi:hypothetical protein